MKKEKKQRLTVRLPEELIKDIKLKAVRNKTTASNVIYQILKHHL